MTIARCRICKDAVFNYKHRLCLRHYNRAKERRRLTKGALSWDTVIANAELLNGKRVHLFSSPRQSADPPPPDARSCLTCINLIPIPPLKSLACDKNQFGSSFRYISIDAVERGGVSPHLVGRAKNCPFFRLKP